DAAGLADALDGVGRHAGGDALLEDALAGVADLPGEPGAGRLDDAPGRLDALRPDAVAGDEGDQFLAVGGGVHGAHSAARLDRGGRIGWNRYDAVVLGNRRLSSKGAPPMAVLVLDPSE